MLHLLSDMVLPICLQSFNPFLTNVFHWGRPLCFTTGRYGIQYFLDPNNTVLGSSRCISFLVPLCCKLPAKGSSFCLAMQPVLCCAAAMLCLTDEVTSPVNLPTICGSCTTGLCDVALKNYPESCFQASHQIQLTVSWSFKSKPYLLPRKLCSGSEGHDAVAAEHLFHNPVLSSRNL